MQSNHNRTAKKLVAASYFRDLENMSDFSSQQIWLGAAAVFGAGLAVGLLAQSVLPLSGALSQEEEKNGLDASGSQSATDAAQETSVASDAESSEDESESDDDEYMTRNLKQVMAIRTDLGMGKGKQCAQCCHASLGAWQNAQYEKPKWAQAWSRYGCAKIAVKCPSEETMDGIAAACEAAGVPFYVVEDAGRTQVAPGSRTCCGIGPAPVELIDQITGPAGQFPLKLM